MTAPHHHHRRAHARARAARVWRVCRAWWQVYNDFVVGPVLIVVAIIVAIGAINYFNNKEATAKAAKAQCERSRILAPGFARDADFTAMLARERGIREPYNAEERALIRASVLKSCPK